MYFLMTTNYIFVERRELTKCATKNARVCSVILVLMRLQIAWVADLVATVNTGFHYFNVNTLLMFFHV